MKFARMDGNRVVETFEHPENPAALFDPTWIWVECPAETVQGSTRSGNRWTHPAPAAPVEVTPAAPVKRTVVTPVEYFGLFSPLEEYAIRDAAKGDSDDAKILSIFLSRLDHPSLTSVDLASPQVQAGLGLLVQMGKIDNARKAVISAGV